MNGTENGDQFIKKGRRKLFSPPMLTSSNDSLFPSLSSASKLLFSQSLPRPMPSSATPAIGLAGDILPDEVVSHPWSRFSGDIPAAPSLGEDLLLTQIFQNRKSTKSSDDPETILGDTAKLEFLFPSDTTSLLLSQNQNFLSSRASPCAGAACGISSDVTMDRLQVDSSNHGFRKKGPEFPQKLPDDNSFLLGNYDSQENYSSELNSQLDLYHPSSEAIFIDKFIQPEPQSDLFKSGILRAK